MNRKMIGEAIYIRFMIENKNPIATKRGNVPILWPVRQIRWFPYVAPSVVERLQATLSMPLNDRGILDYSLYRLNEQRFLHFDFI